MCTIFWTWGNAWTDRSMRRLLLFSDGKSKQTGFSPLTRSSLGTCRRGLVTRKLPGTAKRARPANGWPCCRLPPWRRVNSRPLPASWSSVSMTPKKICLGHLTSHAAPSTSASEDWPVPLERKPRTENLTSGNLLSEPVDPMLHTVESLEYPASSLRCPSPWTSAAWTFVVTPCSPVPMPMLMMSSDRVPPVQRRTSSKYRQARSPVSS
mmetsp:Transcript_20989/g.65639  ORF Transcript_20989/g.65639 Transcript_20989/m.65639 type:complete len:209 (+) Transcript_20989:108-734(+)